MSFVEQGDVWIFPSFVNFKVMSFKDFSCFNVWVKTNKFSI